MANTQKPTDWSPLDLAQYSRIGPVHHGFAYQHLLGGSIALTSIESASELVLVRFESDEDLEFELASTYSYLQVKATSDSLTFSEISTAIVRFARLRAQHALGNRRKEARFRFIVGGPIGAEILSNKKTAPTGSLRNKLEDLATKNKTASNDLFETWSEIDWLVPGDTIPELPDVRVMTDALSLFGDLTRRLDRIPRLRNSAEAAAFTLGAAVQMICADSMPAVSNRTLTRDDCQRLVERVVAVAEKLPPLPARFVPPRTAARIIDADAKTLLVGISGSGKSTYLAWEALGSPARAVEYVRLRGETVAVMTADLLGQLALILSDALDIDARARVLSTAIPSEERLATCAQAIPLGTCLIVDDAHRFYSSDPPLSRFVRDLVARKGMGVVFSCQSAMDDGAPTVLALRRMAVNDLVIKPVPLWSRTEIARWAAQAGNLLSIGDVQRVHETTGGLPIATISLINTAFETYNGSIEKALLGIDLGTDTSTADAILAAGFDALPTSAKEVAATLAVIGFSPTADELSRILTPEQLRPGLRRLVEFQMARRTPGPNANIHIELHEAYATLARLRAPEILDTNRRRALHANAATMLEGSLREGEFGFTRTLALYRNLVEAGEIEKFVEFLTGTALSGESLARAGLGAAVADLVTTGLAKASSPAAEFWMRDTSLYLEFGGFVPQGNWRAMLDKQRDALDRLGDDKSARSALLHKALLFEGKLGDESSIKKAWRQLKSRAHDTNAQLVADYTLATIWFERVKPREVLNICTDMIRAYCKPLGFGDFLSIWTEKNEKVRAMVKAPPVFADRWLIQLGDCFDLAGRALVELGQDPISMFSHASTMYNLTYSVEPLVKSNLELFRILAQSRATAPMLVEYALALRAGLQRVETSRYYLAVTAWAALGKALLGDRAGTEILLDEVRLYRRAEVGALVLRAEQALVSPPDMSPPRFDISGGPINAAFMRLLMKPSGHL